MGMEVRLISRQYVSPFVKTKKNDRNDFCGWNCRTKINRRLGKI